jgi:hypothetical protein
MPSTRRNRTFLATIGCVLLWAATAHAQVTLDPRTVEFDPSPDHNSPTLVVRYDLEVYNAGGTTPVLKVSLGKPAPQSDGKIRVDLAAALGTFLASGPNYESRVVAVSDANATGRSTLSNQFAFTASCAATISPTSSSIAGGAGTGTFNVNAAAGCAWSAVSMASWITITGGASGSGNGTVTYSVSANPSTSPRTGQIAAGGQTFTLNQAGACSFTISPTSASWSASAASGSVSVTTTAGCAWSASSPVSWITFSGPTSGTGNGSVNYSVAANTSTTARNTTLSIAGRAFTVNQAGVVCTPTLSASGVTVASGGGPGTVSVTVAGGCTWTASSGVSWITITGGSPGNGDGTVSYNVAPNGTATSRTGNLTIAGQTYTVTQEGITCSFSVSPTSSSVAAAASTGTATVTAPGGCAWTAVSNASWITVTSGASGSGNGSVGYSVAANTTVNPRSGSITIGGQTFTINQAAAPCTFSISPTSASAPSAASSSTIAVTVATGCNWTAVSNASWITVTSGGSGNGNGTVNYSVAANTSTAPRSGTITVAGQTFTVNQAGVPCTFTISPTGASTAPAGATGTITVTTQAGCSWTAASNATPWITVTGGTPGSGNGTVNYSVAANTSILSRSGTITVAGQTFTVTQSGIPCTFTLSPTARSVASGSTSGTVGVTAPGGCTWTATPSASWITITSGASGSGNGTINYTVAANPSTSERTGTIAAGGELFTITQAGAPCVFTITPASVSVGATATTGTVAVAAQAGCAWSAVSNASWITVTAGASGSGNGTVSYSIAANTTITGRTGTVTIAGQTFTVTQAGIPCTFTLAPTGASVAAGATTGTVTVTAPAGCTWSASSNQTWAAITGGATGNGNGTVSYSVAANGTTSPRSATLTIAGQSFALTQAGGSCNFAVSPASDTVPAAGGTNRTIGVTVQAGCAWSATPSASWITVTGGGTGNGNGTVTYQVAANTSTSQRSATIAIGSQVVTITQDAAACSYTLTPASVKVGSNSSNGSATVTAQPGCGWTATPAATWLTITSGGSGTGNGTINYSVAANPGTGKRTAGISLSGEGATASMTVEQDGVPCSYGLSPTTENVAAAGANRTVAMTAQAGCAWTATPSASWITITAGGSGSGNGTVSYTVAANASTTGRTGTIAAGGELLTITQAGAACALSIAPGSISVDANASTGTVTVTGQPGCTWTAASTSSWITVTSGASGTGNGTVSYSIAANPSTNPRIGGLTIAGQTFTVTQAGVACTFTIAPTGATVSAGATSGTVAVTAAAGCTWNASSQASWIIFSGNTSGSGNGTVSYNVAANPNTTGRSGTITIAGQTFTVTQEAVVCTFSVSPTNVVLGWAATSLPINVTTGGSCAWSASSSVSWVTLGSGGGPGSGNATFNVSSNTTGAIRSGTLTVAGQTIGVTQAAGSCTYSISPSLVNVGADATTVPVTVTTQGGCPWSSSSAASWATFPSGGTGSGPGTVAVDVASNPDSFGRLATLTIGGRSLVLDQAGNQCSYSLAPTGVSVGQEGATGSFAVTASNGCSWTPSSSASWVGVSGSGTGNGSVTYSVAANTTGASRSASVSVGNRSFTITQGGSCSYSISPTDVSVGETATSGSVIVTGSVGCTWNASSTASWLTITSGASGTGNGAVNYSVAGNPGGPTRTGTLNVAGNVFTVVQSSCDITVTPGTVTVAAPGGTTYALVRAGGSCSWNASTSTSWISIPGGTSGTGVDWVTIQAAANPGGSTRTGSVNVSGEVVTVVQNGACTLVVTPTTVSAPTAGGVQTVNVATGAGCSWSVTSQASWITINSGSTSGSGNASPAFTVASNPGAARTGTIRISGVTITINQSGGPTLTAPKGIRIVQ